MWIKVAAFILLVLASLLLLAACSICFSRLTVEIQGQGLVQGAAAGGGEIDCGTGSDQKCSDLFDGDTTISLVAQPDPGWELGSITGDCDSNGVVTLKADVSECTFTFVETGVAQPTEPLEEEIDTTSAGGSQLTPFQLQVRIVGPGMVTITPPGTSCEEGDAGCIFDINQGTEVRLVATPLAGATLEIEFDEWQDGLPEINRVCEGLADDDELRTESEVTLTMDADKDCKAIFTR